MKSLALLFFLLPTVTANPQQHAPTVEQCRADAAVWDLTSMSQTQRDAITVVEAQNRYDQMADCAKVDVEHADTYFARVSFYGAFMSKRLEHFLRRHNLMQQFIDEDAAGMR